MTQSLADMRREYTRDGLSEANAPSDPSACSASGSTTR